MYLPIHLDILRSYTYANYTLMNKLPHKCFWWNLIVLSWIHQQTVIPFIIIHFDIIILLKFKNSHFFVYWMEETLGITVWFCSIILRKLYKSFFKP